MKDDSRWLSLFLWFGIGGGTCSNFLASTVFLYLYVHIYIYIYVYVYIYMCIDLVSNVSGC